jgi:hypothetical protein
MVPNQRQWLTPASDWELYQVKHRNRQTRQHRMPTQLTSWPTLKHGQNVTSALLFAILFFVLSPPCTPIFIVLYPASHKLVLCLCDTLFFVDMNLQPVNIYWAVSTVNKWKAQCSGPYNLSIVQYTAFNALYYSIHSQTFSFPPSTTCLLSELAYIGCVTSFETG